MPDNADSFAVPTDFQPLCPEFLGAAINTLFDRAAERWSERIAIKESRHHCTCRELQQHVDRLAAMLATLKAGGFYMVTDPRYPAERNTAIPNNSEAGWAIIEPVLTRLKLAVCQAPGRAVRS